jgi:tRNA-specific 2-thiouridylase
VNLQQEFKSRVIRPFITSYLEGETPIPCTLCNTFLKFDTLLDFARKVGIELIATGHYARIRRKSEKGYLMFKGQDAHKDQSYFLFELSQEQLAKTLFPVGDFDKSRIRAIAEENGLRTAEKPDSQEICFIPDGDYAGFIKSHTEEVSPDLLPVLQNYNRPGLILFKDGQPLGTHPGIYHFTLGQRRGLKIAHEKPLYVMKLDPTENTVTVGYQEDVYSGGLLAERVNWLSRCAPSDAFEAKVKIRANHEAAAAELRVRNPSPGGLGGPAVEVTFREPQLAITPGQAAVFYHGDQVLGGGWITSATQG